MGQFERVREHSVFLTTGTVCRAVPGSQTCHRIRGLFHWHSGYCWCVFVHISCLLRSLLKCKHQVQVLKVMLHIWSRSQELEESEMVLHGVKLSRFGCFLSVFTVSMERIVVSNVTDSAKSPTGSQGCFLRRCGLLCSDLSVEPPVIFVFRVLLSS